MATTSNSIGSRIATPVLPKLMTLPGSPGGGSDQGTEAPLMGRLFRTVDWIAFAVVTLIVLTGYLLTIAPDLTLEDSGELAVASMYAGVPHPPGYPIWTLYTWLFTKLLPFSNISWRVAVSSAFAAAVSAGMVAMLVSRGSVLILESIEMFRDRDRKWDDRISLVTGFVGGMLLGFNGYVWSQAVIVEVYTIALWSLMGVFVCLKKFTWMPEHRRHLYLAFFLFGLCFCNHQTLIVAAMGLEVIVLMADRRLGRDFLAANTFIWVLMLAAHAAGKINTFRDNESLMLIFNLVGILSAIGCVWAAISTGGLGDRLHVVLLAAVAFLIGVSFYFYMPLASSTNPPLNWGYPRTWDGFVHAFTRGQYEKTSPGISLAQIWAYLEGAKEEFNWSNLLVALLPIGFMNRMRQREKGWLIGLGVTYVCLAFLLMYLLNAQTDKQSRELVKVFYTSSHVIIALSIGYGLAIVAGLLQCGFKERRLWIGAGAAVAVAVNLRQLVEVMDPNNNLFVIPRVAAVLSLALATLFLGLLLVWRERTHLAPVLGLFLLLPADSILDHWSDNEQRDHYFGYWFGHDMFEPGMDTSAAPAPKDVDGTPLYPSMAEHTVLFGGTDPGRFCPTYMIFCESFIPPQNRRNPKFDRRDVYLITQNALADNTYLDYIRAHYNRSAQVDPPFFLSMLNDPVSTLRGRTNWMAGMMGPFDRWMTSMGDSIEKRRRSGESRFKPADFLDLNAFQTRLGSGTDPVSGHLRTALGGTVPKDAEALANALNTVLEGPSIHDAQRFAEVVLSPHVALFARQNPDSHNRIRLNRLLIEAAYPGMIAGSPGGLYPDREILTPTPEDLRRCFEEYSVDAQRRAQQGQLKQGEILTQLPDGRVSVHGQTAVMSINGLLTKVIFDKNPDHEFYIEESFPLDWMYPHLVPYGIIMKIERQPVAQISEEQVRRDHEYWSQYSERFIGNWIQYETPIEEICEFALRTYRLRDHEGFKGDARFVRDDNAQKAFSKLRNAIGKSIYMVRAQEARDPAYQARMLKEAEFALKQAFAFCPYSPETVFNLASLLAVMGRYADAYRVVETCYALDPDNRGIAELLNQLKAYKDTPASAASAIPSTSLSPQELKANLTNLESAFNLASSLFNSGRSNEGVDVLNTLVEGPNVDARTLVSVAQAFQQLQRIDRMEATLERYTRLLPESPEAWYQLAAVQAVQFKSSSSAGSLRKAFELSDLRRATNASLPNLRTQVVADPRFDPIRDSLDPKL
jgi:Flp pilus assembly protein TadD